MSSPISTQRRSVRESSAQFEARMCNRVSLFKSADSCFFHKRVTKTMATEVVKGPFAYALEIPVRFLAEHGKKFGKDVTFVRKGTKRTWPIELTIRTFESTVRGVTQAKARVFAYGAGGWKKFLTENQIKVGDILIFNLIGWSRFQVVIGRAPVQVHPDDHEGDNSEGRREVIGRAPVHVHPNDKKGDNNEGEVDMDIDVGYEYDRYNQSSAKWFRNVSPWWNADQAPVSCRACKQAPPCPRFLVAIRSSSHFSLAVPGRFWELHASMLECDDLQLRGPNKAIFIVQAKQSHDAEERKLNVRLESGWEAFFRGNALKVGDILEFFLVGNSRFTVDLVERVEEY